MKRLEGKTALVSGAASGIGRASALLFAQHGANVVVLDRAPAVEDTAAAIRRAGGKAHRLRQGFSEEANVAHAIDSAVREFGALDVCFANAGVSGGLVPLQEQTPEHWTEILKINLIGTFLAVKHAARVMTPRKRGSIICTASVAGLRSGAGGSPYSASKAGVVSLVQTTAYQLERQRRAHQCDLPGADRNRHDAADLRAGARPRHRSQDRSAQSAAPRRRARARSRRWRCSSLPTTPRTSTARRSRSTAACRARTRSCRRRCEALRAEPTARRMRLMKGRQENTLMHPSRAEARRSLSMYWKPSRC